MPEPDRGFPAAVVARHQEQLAVAQRRVEAPRGGVRGTRLEIDGADTGGAGAVFEPGNQGAPKAPAMPGGVDRQQ